jgi:hypothetical protein
LPKKENPSIKENDIFIHNYVLLLKLAKLNFITYMVIIYFYKNLNLIQKILKNNEIFKMIGYQKTK